MQLTEMADSFEEITNVYYKMMDDESEVCVVVTDETEYQVPNGGYTIENPALQLMGYFGASPRTFEDELPGRFLPTHDTITGARVIDQRVFNNGKWALQNADWVRK